MLEIWRKANWDKSGGYGGELWLRVTHGGIFLTATVPTTWSRSQPPFFAFMVELLAQHEGDDALKYYCRNCKEYAYWMEGVERTRGNKTQRVVKLEDGGVLNRWDDKGAPA